MKNLAYKFTLLAALLTFGTTSLAHALPEEIKNNYPDLVKVGQSDYYFFFIDVYDIELYQVEKVKDILALKITYNRDIAAKKRIEHAVEAIDRQGNFSPKTLSAWEGQMASIFPDVKEGDSITVFQNESMSTEFYHNDDYRGVINSPEFTQAFIGTWLGKHATDQSIKHDLLKDAFHTMEQP